MLIFLVVEITQPERPADTHSIITTSELVFLLHLYRDFKLVTNDHQIITRVYGGYDVECILYRVRSLEMSSSGVIKV